MKIEIREIITDIKAAILIGEEDSLWISLETMLELPQISGNPKMEDSFINQAILPIGEALADSKLSYDEIIPIGKTSFAAFRGVCAVALTIRLFTQDEGSILGLESFSNDTRQDVRLSLSNTIAKYGIFNPRKFVEITEHYFNSDSPRSFSVSIRLLPALLEVHPDKAFEFLSRVPFSNDNDLRLAFSNTLNQMALSGHELEILEVMDSLADQQDDYLWVITKSLSGAWASKEIDKTLNLLEKLSRTFGAHKLISNSLKAMRRHGASKEVDQKLLEWGNGTEEKLQYAAKQFKN